MLEIPPTLAVKGMQTIGSREASNGFGKLLSTTSQGQPFVVTRNGTPQAVMLPIHHFELMGGEKQLFAKIAEDLQATRARLIQLTHEIQEEAERNGFKEENLEDFLVR